MTTGLSDRGLTGVLPRPGALADESYLDFLESFRGMLLAQYFPAIMQAGHARMAADGLPVDDPSVPLKTIEDSFHKAPIVPTWQRFLRSQQEMMWRRVRNSYVPIADAHETALRDAESKGPGKLVLDPSFDTPDYARREIHLQPGGYTDDPLGGLVFHYGTKCFYMGANDQDELHLELATMAQVPEDGRVSRVLDLACSIGQATLHLKQRFPMAEVWGLDVGKPMVRYAHYRATQVGADVNYIQALAEATTFPDAHFDMVHAYILFHEVPVAVIPDILAEVHRILRPGGVFSVFEFPNFGTGLPPAYRFMIANDSRDNCEPYSPDFVACDFQGMLRAAGFDVQEGAKTQNGFLQTLFCTKAA
jgi:ubiquinone/menaquinone biosynthesis C-methylase UbiE